jgi:hypothetical protein
LLWKQKTTFNIVEFKQGKLQKYKVEVEEESEKLRVELEEQMARNDTEQFCEIAMKAQVENKSLKRWLEQAKNDMTNAEGKVRIAQDTIHIFKDNKKKQEVDKKWIMNQLWLTWKVQPKKTTNCLKSEVALLTAQLDKRESKC